MNKEVIVSLNGLHTVQEENENVQVIAPGLYYNKDGKHYIVYNEISEETSEINKNTIKVKDNSVEIIRKGSGNVHMIFEEKKKNISYYNTPFGNLLIGISTNRVKIVESPHEMDIEINYSLEANDEHLSDCVMRINVKSKEGASINLM